MKFVKEHFLIVAGILAAVAYYLYSKKQAAATTQKQAQNSPVQSTTPQISVDLSGRGGAAPFFDQMHLVV